MSYINKGSKDLIKGFIPEYSTTTAVSITAGYAVCNGARYEKGSATTHTVTSLASGADFHYIYIDDSASSQTAIVFIDSTTEPTEAIDGWYNGDDRCIGVVYSSSAGATIAHFSSIPFSIGGLISYNWSDGFQMASLMNPNGLWQTPDDLDGDVITPVNARYLISLIGGSDSANVCIAKVMNKEDTDALVGGGWTTWGGVGSSGYDRVYQKGFVELGTSRQVRLYGQDDDDNGLQLWAHGYVYER